ncbi:PhnD/SsuA/transferrin family substrate-binding protein [Neisseriaceae bacterium ESL0693]|nr:PhnD/SsuA/transferrin family substrate-binding protein [Neisseriaceae bacterium ESL0693]
MISLMVVPDYMPDQFSTWYMLNNYLQKKSGQNISIIMPSSFEEVDAQQKKEKVSLLYLNPFYAGTYVHDQGYLPLVRPKNKFDEVMIVTAATSPLESIEELSGDVTIALSLNEDTNYIGLRLLDSANLSDDQIITDKKDNFLMVASSVIRQSATIGVIQKDVFEKFNDITKNQLKVLLKSRIREVSHVMVYDPSQISDVAPLKEALIGMYNDESGKSILKSLDFPEGFEELNEETMEFMIDIVDTMR